VLLVSLLAQACVGQPRLRQLSLQQRQLAHSSHLRIKLG
jgi:hypothetical protein